MSTPLASPEDPLLYTSLVEVRPSGGPNKHVHLPADQEVTMGAHGPLAEFMRVDPAEHPELPSTLDYVVGATTACLTGTFKRALAARDIHLEAAHLTAHGTGEVRVAGAVPLLRAIHVIYVIRAPLTASDRAVVKRVHGFHHRGCAVSRSLEGSVTITTELDLR